MGCGHWKNRPTDDDASFPDEFRPPTDSDGTITEHVMDQGKAIDAQEVVTGI